MWGSVETTVKLGLTGLAGFTLACVVIETAGTFIGTAVAGSSNGQNYFVARCVEIKFYGAFVLILRVNLHAIDATPARWRGDAGSSPLDRARTAASSPRNDFVKNCRVHLTHCLISTQVTRTLVELLLALYVADFVTGLIHMLLDFQTVDDDELRLHIETSVEAVEAFEKTKLFTEATERDRYLWNFHSHHEAVYPSSDSQLELFMQLFWYVRVVWPLFYPVHKSNCRSGAGSMAWRHAPDSLVDLRTGST
jgi:hypothetical protein